MACGVRIPATPSTHDRPQRRIPLHTVGKKLPPEVATAHKLLIKNENKSSATTGAFIALFTFCANRVPPTTKKLKDIMTRFHTLIAAATLLASTQAHAATITVLPTDVGAPGFNTWYLANYRGASNGFSSTTKAAITTANPRSGNGSVQMSLTDLSGKADYTYTWGFDNSRTLGSLTSLNYDWFRSGTSTASGIMPALRLLYDADGNAATGSDQGYLIFEQVYNPNAASVVSDQWVTSNLMTANLWQRQFSPGFTVESFGVSMNDWISGANQPANADRLNGNTAILGIEFGIGSGWDGSFNGFVDNVSFGFNQNVTTFNFEASAASAVPEPASIALLSLGLIGFAAARRRKVK